MTVHVYRIIPKFGNQYLEYFDKNENKKYNTITFQTSIRK